MTLHTANEAAVFFLAMHLACTLAELFVGSDTTDGSLSLARWNFTTNLTSPLGPPLTELRSSPNLAASLLVLNSTWVLTPYETTTTDRLIQFSVLSGALDGVSVELGPEERCFLLYVMSADADGGTIHCLSEVVAGTLSSTALRTIDRASGAKRLLATVLPHFSPSGIAAHDSTGGDVRAVYFYSPADVTTSDLAQGNYLVTLADATAAIISTVLIAPELRVLQIARGHGRTFAVTMVGSGAVYAGVLDDAAAFLPLPVSPDFSRSFTSIGTTALTLGDGALWFSLWKEAGFVANGGPPTYTPWLLGVDNATGALIYEASGGADLDFSYLQWSSEESS